MTKKRVARRGKRPGSRDAEQQNLTLLRHLHRGDTGFVQFQYRDLVAAEYGAANPEVPVTLTYEGTTYKGSLPVQVLHRWHELLPEVRESLMRQLLYDGRATVNTVWRPKPFPNAQDYERVNAAMVDLDCRELDYDEAFARVARLVADKVLPTVSIVLDTGNGLHVFWLLRGDPKRPELAPRSFPSNRTKLVDINRAMIERVKAAQPELQPDAAPVFVTTHTRVPGSINTRTNSRVVINLNLTADGIPPTYTLDELREFLGVPERESTRQVRATRADGTPPNPVKQRAHRARWEQLLHELDLLGRARGGFREGHRRHAVYLMATFMRGSGQGEDRIYHAAEQLGDECHPPLQRHEARANAKSGLNPNRRPPRNTTIAERLGVTVDEANGLDLVKIRPDFEALPATAGGRKGRKLIGLAFLQRLMEKHGPTLPYTYESLQVEFRLHGLNPALGTVKNWLDAAGAKVAASRGRYKQPSPQRELLGDEPTTTDEPVN